MNFPTDSVVVDRGYRGHDEIDSAVYLSGLKRWVSSRIKRCVKRCLAIEPIIYHLKTDGWLERNHLKGTESDSINVLLNCAGHNLRLILKRLKELCANFFFVQYFTRLFTSNWLCREQNSVMQR